MTSAASSEGGTAAVAVAAARAKGALCISTTGHWLHGLGWWLGWHNASNGSASSGTTDPAGGTDTVAGGGVPEPAEPPRRSSGESAAVMGVRRACTFLVGEGPRKQAKRNRLRVGGTGFPSPSP